MQHDKQKKKNIKIVKLGVPNIKIQLIHETFPAKGLMLYFPYKSMQYYNDMPKIIMKEWRYFVLILIYTKTEKNTYREINESTE